MVLLGLMGGALTEKPLDLRPILFKRLRIQGTYLLRPAAQLLMRLVGTTLRSRTLEYQSKLLQEFSAKAIDHLFSKCSGGHGLDLVIHKVRISRLHPCSIADVVGAGLQLGRHPRCAHGDGGSSQHWQNHL